MNGVDHPTKPSASIEMQEGTMTPALTQEHRAKVHSSAPDVGMDAEALATACGHPFIKPEPLDPQPVTFTGKLRVINNELEIVKFMPA